MMGENIFNLTYLIQFFKRKTSKTRHKLVYC